MVDSFGRLWRQERLTGGGNIPEYLRTHPASAARMERMESMLNRYSPGKNAGYNREFLRVKTRLQALYLSIADAYDLFRSRVRQHPEDAMAQYGLALVEIRQGNYRQAEEIAARREEIIETVEASAGMAGVVADMREFARPEQWRCRRRRKLGRWRRLRSYEGADRGERRGDGGVDRGDGGGVGRGRGGDEGG
jgi:hypothetical protein